MAEQAQEPATSSNNNNNQEEEEEEEWITQRNEFKQSGDEAYRASKYHDAIRHYTHAIELEDPDAADAAAASSTTTPADKTEKSSKPSMLAILYSNRSASYLQTSQKSRALQDARRAVSASPHYLKAHLRLAGALCGLGRYHAARDAYREALKLEGEGKNGNRNEAVKKGLEYVQDKLKQVQRKEKEAALAAAAVAAATKKKEEEEQQQKEKEKKQDSDDVLDDFFSEVEQSQSSSKPPKAKPPPPPTESKPEPNNNNKEEDLLDDFFSQVESKPTTTTTTIHKTQTQTQTQTQEEPTSNRIQSDNTDLSTPQNEINRILSPNYKWKNLNPLYVFNLHTLPLAQLSNTHFASQVLPRRYKALSLKIHPDKLVSKGLYGEEWLEKARLAFDELRKAKGMLEDEDKRRHVLGLVEAGRKLGKKQFLDDNKDKDKHKDKDKSNKTLQEMQEVATMKLFADIEQKRREVERRKRKFEAREQAQEDEEVEKLKRQETFEKGWRQEGRVEGRVGNWRSFQKKKK